jgi:hypothetical protein
MHPVDVATNLLEAFNAGDLGRMRELLAPGLDRLWRMADAKPAESDQFWS